MIDTCGRNCRIFLCYRDNGVETAKSFYDSLNNIIDSQYGKVWFSDYEGKGNYVIDIERLLSTAEFAVLFISKDFTKGFLKDDGTINISNDQTDECVTVREIVEIEHQRQKRNLEVLCVNIDGSRFDEGDLTVLKQVFEKAKVIRDDTLQYYKNMQNNSYNRRSTLMQVFIKTRFSCLELADEKSDVNKEKFERILNYIQYKEIIEKFELTAREIRNGLLNAVLYCNCKWGACTFDMETQHTNTCEGLLALLSCNEHHNHTDIIDECLSILSDELNENGLPSKSLGIATVVPTSMYLFLSAFLKDKIDMNVISQLSNKLYESREKSGWGIYVKKMGRNTNIGCTYWAIIGLLSSGIVNNDLIQKSIVSLFKFNGTYCFGRNIDEVNPRIPCLYSTSMMYILYSHLSSTNKELVNKRYDYRKALEIIIKEFDNPFFLIEEEGIQGVEIPERMNVHTVNWNHITIHYSLKALSIAMHNNHLSQPEIISVLGRVSHLFEENCQLNDSMYYWSDPKISIEKGARGKLIFPTMHAIMGLSSIIDYVNSIREDNEGDKR